MVYHSLRILKESAINLALHRSLPVTNNAGKLSNGISSIQSMYAPEMSAHSERVSVNIKEIQN
jgi:hypothetical protein